MPARTCSTRSTTVVFVLSCIEMGRAITACPSLPPSYQSSTERPVLKERMPVIDGN